ncbi:DUF5615 family PIN-like protein [Sphaerospermopsis sp. LEGE 08334]|uniref:DUF5615 family PIN-like protein n=1 Tax=Sphaerospermopsis sp. LEGE 08334 TaxID=1828651 RepID=UPI001D139353|nr:DUF5615 family PIN-like protein [Sphaerospermopsis sp. LEGE 08334]
MNNLRFIADVHISPLTVAALKLKGYDILRCTDLLPNTAADVDILELARVENRIIINSRFRFFDVDSCLQISPTKFSNIAFIFCKT